MNTANVQNRWWRARMPVGWRVSWWGAILAGVVYSVLLGLSLPPVSAWPLALVAIVPLVWAGCGAGGSGGRAWLAGAMAGLGTLPGWLVQSWWLVDVTAPGYPGLAAYLSVYPGVFVWLVALARRVDWGVPMAVVVPLAWGMLEVVRGEIALTGYAWYLLGHPLIDVPGLSAPGAVVSAYGVSMLVAGLAGAVADAAGWSGVHRPIGGVGALGVCAVWGGLSAVGRPGAESGAARDVVIGVVQTNVPQSNKMGWAMADRLRDFARFVDLTRQAAAGPPGPVEADVVVWPETMFPGWSLNPAGIETERGLGLSFRVEGPAAEGFAGGRVPATHFADELASVQRSLGVPLLVGGIAVEGEYERWWAERLGAEKAGRGAVVRRYNSAVVVSGGKVQEKRYDKVELTPFGEMIPYVWRFPRLQAMVLELGAAGMSFDLSAGTMVGGLDIQAAGGKKLRAATPICFEATKAALCRALILGDGAGGVVSGAGRASVLINLSNDGWFGGSDMGRAQHLLASRWRCVEMGVPMVRSVNTGYSAAIDRQGRVTGLRLLDGGEPRARVDGVLVAGVRIDPERSATVFERVGLGPARAAAVLGLIGTIALLVRRRRLAALGV